MGNGHCKGLEFPGFFESWVAVAIGGSAVVGAAGSYMSSKEANKPKTGKTDQTTSQTPYLNGWIEPDINAALQYQRGIIAQGAPQIGPGGQITYSHLPFGYEGGDQARANGGGGGAGGGQGIGGPKAMAGRPPVPPGGSERPDGRIMNAAGQTIWTPPKAAGSGSGSKGKGGKAVTGAAGPTQPGGKAPVNYQDPKQIFAQVAQRGLDAGNTKTVAQGRAGIGNILGAAGGGGPEQTGFEGYNPILDRLAGRLETDADSRVSKDLILGFLNENNRGTVGGNNNGANGQGGQGGRTGSNVIYRPSGSRAAAQAMATNPERFQQGVPDTMATPSYFAEQTRKMMDEQANEAELSALINALNEDTEKGMFRNRAALDAAAAGSGRFGGDMWKGMTNDLTEETLQEMNKTGAQIRVGDLEARRQARLAALGMVNTRDLGLLGANVQREGIAANERSSSAASAAAAAANADQMALARRGQDLSALGALMDYEQGGMNQLGQVGGQLSSDRMAALGMIPGLEGVGLSGLGAALNAGGGLVDMRGQDTSRAIANMQNSTARAGMNQQLGMWNAGQQQNMVNNYMNLLQGIGGMGGTSRTVGTNVQPGLGVSPAGAALTGAAGGAATGAGIYGQIKYGGY